MFRPILYRHRFCRSSRTGEIFWRAAPRPRPDGGAKFTGSSVGASIARPKGFPPRGRHSRPPATDKIQTISSFFSFPLELSQNASLYQTCKAAAHQTPRTFSEKNFFPLLNFCQMRPYRYSVRRWQSSSTNRFVVKRQPYKRRVYHDLCT